MDERDEEFTAFVAARSGPLLRYAYLLTGDLHRAEDIGASANWDWLVASRADTPTLLSAFGLEPGPVEAHDSVYLLGDFRTGRFWRIPGVPDPEALIDHARQIAP